MKNLKIRTRLVLTIIIVMVLVVAQGVFSYSGENQLFVQAQTLYEHPLRVKEAVGNFWLDILNARVNLRMALQTENENAMQESLTSVRQSLAEATLELQTIQERYLGPSSDVREVYRTYASWSDDMIEMTGMIANGEVARATEHANGSVLESERADLMASIDTIDTEASNTANSLYGSFLSLDQSLRSLRMIFMAAIFGCLLLLSYYLFQSIRRPLDDLAETTRLYREGDLGARCVYTSKNEFGQLSDSLNSMIDSIQQSRDLNEKAIGLSSAMLSNAEPKEFFRATLTALSEFTGAQGAAVYLLSADQKTYDHYDSIGMGDGIREKFDAVNPEGELGMAVSRRTAQYIESIPEDTRFAFFSTAGAFIPREIITVPVVVENEVIAVISLACLTKFKEDTLEFLQRSAVMLSARIQGVLAYQRIKEFRDILEERNEELNAQKAELATQSDELLRQNTELETQKDQLSEASRLKTSFLSNMSHELRTPLNSIIALSGVLGRRLTNRIPEEEYSYLEVIERNGKSLLALINEILDISRIEAGREEIVPSSFNAAQIISEVTDLLAPQAELQGISLQKQLGTSALSMTSDAGKFRHILQNIIGNAVKFTEKGSVKITAKKHGGWVEIGIADTGVGIPEESLPYIFDEFRQADSGPARRFGGTGLGLAIAKKYTDLLGGKISVTSTSGKGTKFILSFPEVIGEESLKAKPEEAAERPPAAPAQPPAGESAPSSGPREKTVLLIEDSEPAIIQIRELLGESGQRVLVARGAEEAFAIMKNTIPDAIVLDLMMPGIDGFETLRLLRKAERTAYIPVLILTAKTITREELSSLRQNHVHQLLQKGDVNGRELRGAIFAMLYPDAREEKGAEGTIKARDGKPTILVVEDNPDNMISVKALLSDQYSLLEATDGREGIDMAKKHLPDLILMDIALPGINGIDAFLAIRGAPETQAIPVVALTASALVQERESILSYGFNAFVPKPINQDELFRVIGEVLYGK